MFSAELSGTTERRYGILIDLVLFSNCVADLNLKLMDPNIDTDWTYYKRNRNILLI